MCERARQRARESETVSEREQDSEQESETASESETESCPSGLNLVVPLTELINYSFPLLPGTRKTLRAPQLTAGAPSISSITRQLGRGLGPRTACMEVAFSRRVRKISTELSSLAFISTTL